MALLVKPQTERPSPPAFRDRRASLSRLRHRQRRPRVGPPLGSRIEAAICAPRILRHRTAMRIPPNVCRSYSSPRPAPPPSLTRWAERLPSSFLHGRAHRRLTKIAGNSDPSLLDRKRVDLTRVGHVFPRPRFHRNSHRARSSHQQGVRSSQAFLNQHASVQTFRPQACERNLTGFFPHRSNEIPTCRQPTNNPLQWAE